MDGELIATIIFYAVMGILIYINRKKFTIIGKIVLAYKTKAPIKWMDKLAKYKHFWKIYGTLCIPIGFLFMFILMQSLIQNSIDIVLVPSPVPGVAPLIPGVRIPGSPLYVPLFYGIISILVLAFVHEFAHGILARTEGLKLKSTGFGLLFVFPLFFVEPDQKDMMRAGRLSRLRIASVGPGTNILLSALITIILASTFIPFFENTLEFTGIKITSIVPDYPAEKAGLAPGDVIIGINNISTLNMTGFSQKLDKIKVGDKITLNLKDGRNLAITTVANPKNESKAYIGFYIEQETDFTSEAKSRYSQGFLDAIIVIFNLLKWISFINLMVGIMNLLPVWGLDGGLMIKDFISYLIKGRNLIKIVTAIYTFSLTILLWNIIGPYLVAF